MMKLKRLFFLRQRKRRNMGCITAVSSCQEIQQKQSRSGYITSTARCGLIYTLKGFVFMKNMQVTYLNHSGFLVETEGWNLLFDYFPDDAAPGEPGYLTPEQLPRDKGLAVFVSHSHHDHFYAGLSDWRKARPDLLLFCSSETPLPPAPNTFPMEGDAGMQLTRETGRPPLQVSTLPSTDLGWGRRGIFPCTTPAISTTGIGRGNRRRKTPPCPPPMPLRWKSCGGCISTRLFCPWIPVRSRITCGACWVSGRSAGRTRCFRCISGETTTFLIKWKRTAGRCASAGLSAGSPIGERPLYCDYRISIQ